MSSTNPLNGIILYAPGVQGALTQFYVQYDQNKVMLEKRQKAIAAILRAYDLNPDNISRDGYDETGYWEYLTWEDGMLKMNPDGSIERIHKSWPEGCWKEISVLP